MSTLQKLHDSEINASIESFYDGCWTARLGDVMNGWLAVNHQLTSFAECETWLDGEARQRYPLSFYATGRHPAGYTGYRYTPVSDDAGIPIQSWSYSTRGTEIAE